MKKKQLKARDIFIEWCDPKRGDKFQCYYSDKIFTALRIPKELTFTYTYDKKDIFQCKKCKSKKIRIIGGKVGLACSNKKCNNYLKK